MMGHRFEESSKKSEFGQGENLSVQLFYIFNNVLWYYISNGKCKKVKYTITLIGY